MPRSVSDRARKSPTKAGPSSWRRAGAAAAAIALSCATAACSTDTKSSSRNDTLRIALTVPDPAYSQIYVAQLLGYFKAQNLDVKISTSTSIVPQTQLTAGQVDLAALGVQSALTLAGAGQPVTVVYWGDGGGTSGFMAAKPEINSPADCKTAGAYAPGTSVNGWANVWKKLYNADFTIQPVTSAPVLASGVASGTFPCTVDTFGQMVKEIQAGKAHLVVDPSKPDTLPAGSQQYQNLDSSLFGLKSNLDGKREAMVRFMKAMQRALAFIKQTSPRALADLMLKSEFWNAAWGTQKELLVAAFASQKPLIGGPESGFVSRANWAKVVAFSQIAGLQQSAAWNYDSIVDMSYYKSATGKS